MMRQAPERQRGAIIVLTLLFLVILLGFAALALDLGRLYVLRTEMQNAADAAAMAAAAELDGREYARSDAVKAAKDLLSHRGRFASEPELLNIIKYNADVDPQVPEENASNAIEFYNWISAEYDDDEPPVGCTFPMIDNDGDGEPDEGAGNGDGYDDRKCLANNDNDARYVRIKLYPELISEEFAEDEYFQISLYFLPVLGLFLEEGTLMTASTRVTSVAGGGGPVYCKYPPLFMCAYKEENVPEGGTYDPNVHYPGIGIGEEVKIRDRAANTPWGPGNIGFLQVDEDIVIPLDNGGTRIESNLGAISAALGNEFITKSCSPAIVSTKTGVNQQKTRKAFNTRFGIYEGNDGYEDAKNAFPPAPNTVDYPMDDVFTEESPDYDAIAYKGDGWNDTECLINDTMLPGCANTTRPETFGRDEYISHNHPPGDPPPFGLDDSRYALYEWELSSILHMPALTLNAAETASLDTRNSTNQEDCSVRSSGKPGSKHCWLHNGAPLVTTPPPGDADRRVMRIAVIKCSKYGINGNTPDINLNPETEGDPFPFHRFFLTQHAQAASDTEFFAEYLGPVEEEAEIDEIKHTVIQLYE